MGSTIAAIVTPRGNAGVGIIRLSGDEALSIATKLLNQSAKDIQPRHAHYARFCDDDGILIDDGLFLYFPAPDSFTGEPVVEIQGHGGQVVQNRLLTQLFAWGAEPAKAGAFSQRAYLNDKLSLDQAEAIMSLINAASDQAASAAQQSLQGVFSTRVDDLTDQINVLRIWVEAAIDFPEEEIDFLADQALHDRFNQIEESFAALFISAKAGRVLSEGIQVAIVGEPNVGKSSLLNHLSEAETAIVSDVAGTTRDVVNVSVLIEGVSLHISDTAGLRHTNDPIESEGIKRAWQAIERAELLILMRSIGVEWSDWMASLPKNIPQLKIVNKMDLNPSAIVSEDEKPLSILNGEGLSEIRQSILQTIGYGASEQVGSFSVRQRHVLALTACGEDLQNARKTLDSKQGELLAEELRSAAQALDSITGRVRLADDLLGDIFGKFCIGK